MLTRKLPHFNHLIYPNDIITLFEGVSLSLDNKQLYLQRNAKMNIEGNSIKRIDCSEIQNCFSFWDFEKNIEKRKRIEFEVENNIRIMYAYILNITD